LTGHALGQRREEEREVGRGAAVELGFPNWVDVIEIFYMFRLDLDHIFFYSDVGLEILCLIGGLTVKNLNSFRCAFRI
jgi:hypothetical protein